MAENSTTWSLPPSIDLCPFRPSFSSFLFLSARCATCRLQPFGLCWPFVQFSSVDSFLYAVSRTPSSWLAFRKDLFIRSRVGQILQAERSSNAHPKVFRRIPPRCALITSQDELHPATSFPDSHFACALFYLRDLHHFGVFGPDLVRVVCTLRALVPSGCFPTKHHRRLVTFCASAARSLWTFLFYEGGSVDSVAARRTLLSSPGFSPYLLLKFFYASPLNFVFGAPLVDARGRCAPVQGTHIVRWPSVDLLCSLFGIRGSRFVKEYRFRVHREDARWRTKCVQRTTSLTTSGAAFSSCWWPSSRKPSPAESACRFGVFCCGVVLSCLSVFCSGLTCAFLQRLCIIPFSPRVFDTPDVTRQEKFLQVFWSPSRSFKEGEDL